MNLDHRSLSFASLTTRGRTCLVWLARIVAILLGLMLLGTGYESVAEAADARAFPPPGQMVDIGGYRLHLRCVGAGSPTVVIDAGLGDWSAPWSSWVQPRAAKTTRVCTYDRAGMGWSDPGPQPRTAAQFARELHTLLQLAHVPGPYVLVGHSAGGLTVRVFTHTYSADVAGVVLIESMHPHQARQPDAAPPPQAAAPTSAWSLATLPARIGLLRVLARPLKLASGLAPELARPYVAFTVIPRYVQTTLDESAGLGESLAQASQVTSFGAKPLTVVTRGTGQDPAWQEMQADLLHLSSMSQQIIAQNSGHNVEFDQPDAAVDAIVQMVGMVGH